MLSRLLEISKHFPEIGIKSSSLAAISKLGYENSKGYVSLSLFLSLLFAIFSSMAYFLAFASAIYMLPVVFLICFALAFLLLLKLPRMELGRRAALLEAELPLSLRSIGMLLEMKVPFQRALSLASKREGELARELKNVCIDMENGVSPGKALSKLALKSDSIAFKRAVAQLVFAFEIGEGGREVRKIGDDLLAVQQHRMRDFASKSAIFGLLFLVSTAVAPTFFLIYTFLSGAVFKSSVSEANVAIVLLVVFPAVSFAIIALSKFSLPPSVFSEKTGDGKLTIATLALAVFSAVLILVLAKPWVYAVFPLMILSLGALFYNEYKKEKAREEIEKYLADAFFAISGMPKSTRIETIFGTMANAGYGELSRQAEISLRQLRAGVKPEAVIGDFGKRSNSPMAKRACDMLLHVLNTNAFEALNGIAEDILRFFEIARERENMLAMQKYTVIFGGFLIPAIIKIALSLLASTNSLSGNGMNGDFLSVVVPVYLIMYSVIAATYASEIESKGSRQAFYFIIISCSS